MIDIIYEDNHLLVVLKPVNVPVQEDNSKDKDFLTMLKEYLKEKYNKPGNVYLGLVHRLDRPVGGIMVFAKTSKCASRLSEQIRNNKFKKTYLAISEGTFLETSKKLENYLYKDVHTNNVTVVNKSHKNAKMAVLFYEVIQTIDNMSLLKINLETGRSHQIRVQMSNIGHALYGDQRYNKNSKIGEQIALYSYGIGFYHPITNEYIEFKAKFPKQKPWNKFEIPKT